jgi:hypothetical protein
MAKPPVSYGNAVKLAPPNATEPLKEQPDSQTRAAEPTPRLGAAQTPVAPPTRRRPMESRSDPTVLYLHPDGKYELKRYALALGPKVKVHDLIMEAVEEWAARHGITAPFRVPSERPRRSS